MFDFIIVIFQFFNLCFSAQDFDEFKYVVNEGVNDEEISKSFKSYFSLIFGINIINLILIIFFGVGE